MSIRNPSTITTAIAIIILTLLVGCQQFEPTPTPAPPTETPRPTNTPVPPTHTPVPPTDTPTPTATPTPTETPLPTMTPTPLPVSALLEPMNHQAQTWNNCGPTSLAITLGYYDQWITQQEARTWFYTPLSRDGGLGWCSIPWSITHYGLMSHAYRFPPTRDHDRKLRPVRALLARGIPVVITQRLSVDRNIGHYRVIQGYDDAAGEFISDDPLLGPGYRIPYDTFVRLAPNGLFPIYPPEMDDQVESLMKETGAYHWRNEEGSTCEQWKQP